MVEVISLLLKHSGDAVRRNRDYPLTSKTAPLPQLNVDDPKYSRILTGAAGALDLTDLLGVGGQLTGFTVGLSEVDGNETALGSFKDGADVFGSVVHGLILGGYDQYGLLLDGCQALTLLCSQDLRVKVRTPFQDLFRASTWALALASSRYQEPTAMPSEAAE